MKQIISLVWFLYLTSSLATWTSAQELAPDWDALLTRTQGWLGADGIYSLDLSRDFPQVGKKKLFWFSDTIGGETRNEGQEYGARQTTNHSFALLDGENPEPDKIEFFWNRENDDSGARAKNLIDGKYWLQDGIIVDGRLWIAAILVGKAWKPDRVDALSIKIDPITGRPDFSDVKIDVRAPLSLKTPNEQLVWGAAICDDADDGFLYVFGYADRLSEGSRKDAVVARVLKDDFEKFDEWRYFDGKEWTPNAEDVLKPEATLARDVSTEFSVSKIAKGRDKGKFLFVYTPGVISADVAYRIGDAPFGKFGAERVFYRSNIPNELPGVKCYNAKAHPDLANGKKVLVSYNVNRLGDLAKRPKEYRPRFIWLELP